MARMNGSLAHFLSVFFALLRQKTHTAAASQASNTHTTNHAR
jgi:hypothetical protein